MPKQASALILSVLLLLSCWVQASGAPEENKVNATDPNYQLITGDTIAIQVLEEPDTAATLLIDKEGQVRPPMLGDVHLAGQTIRNAEKTLEDTYIKEELLKQPIVRISIVDYAPRIVTVLGAVNRPGKVSFDDSNLIDIVDAITLAGGFKPVAKRDQVTVIRADDKGKEESVTLDVEAMMSGKITNDKPRDYALRPGDKVIVKERVF